MEGHLKLRLQSLSIECRGVAPTWSKDVNQINQFSILSPTLDQNWNLVKLGIEAWKKIPKTLRTMTKKAYIHPI